MRDFVRFSKSCEYEDFVSNRLTWENFLNGLVGNGWSANAAVNGSRPDQ
jgi:hypothetical protein